MWGVWGGAEAALMLICDKIECGELSSHSKVARPETVTTIGKMMETTLREHGAWRIWICNTACPQSCEDCYSGSRPIQSYVLMPMTPNMNTDLAVPPRLRVYGICIMLCCDSNATIAG